MNLKNKRLYRSPREAIVLGIAAGLGHYFEVDPVFVRLLWIVAAALTNLWPAVCAYALLFFVIPVDPAQETVAQSQTPKDVTPTPESAEKMDADQNM